MNVSAVQKQFASITDVQIIYLVPNECLKGVRTISLDSWVEFDCDSFLNLPTLIQFEAIFDIVDVNFIFKHQREYFLIAGIEINLL